MLKSLRFKHYSYVVLAALLVVTSVVNIIINLRTAQAELGAVTITSPAENEEINQQTRQITGTAPAIKEVAVFDGVTKLGVTTSSAGGTWSLEWPNPKPGQHSLRAYVTDGNLYKSSPYGQQSVKTHNINSGQVTQNLAAGLSGSSGVVFDVGLQKSFVINYMAGTVSQINPITEELEETIVYNSAPDSSSLGFSRSNPLCRANSSNLTVCAYTYSQQSHKLYLLESSELNKNFVYIINTQNKSVEAKVEVDPPHNVLNQYGDDAIADNQSYDLDYRLYLDPQNSFVYVYHQGVPSQFGTLDASNMKLERINVQTKTLDTTWNKAATAVVSSAAGDVFFADYVTGEPLTNQIRQNIKVLRVNETEVESVDVPNGECDYQATDLALSKDESYLYAACRDTNKAKKIVAIATSDGQVAAVEERSGEFLTKGNLTSQKLLLATDDGTTIQVFNTQNNTLAPEIQPLVGSLQKQSLVVDGTNEKFYFSTLDLDNALNHLYEVDLSSSSILQNRTYDLTEFSGTRAAAITDAGAYLFVSTQKNEALHTVTLSSGAHSQFEYGMGSSTGVLYSPSTERLFSMSLSSPLSSANDISVANAVDGTYEAKIQLPGNYSISSMAFNDNESTLYALAIDFGTDGSGSNLKLFAIDTSTLQISQIFNSLNQYAPENPAALVSGIAVRGNLLAFTDLDTIYAVNLQNDTTQTSPLGAEYSLQDEVLFTGFTPFRVAINQSGTKIAVIRDLRHVTIRNTTNLSESLLVDIGELTNPVILDISLGINFTTDDVFAANQLQLPWGSGVVFYNAVNGTKVAETPLSPFSVSSMCIPVELNTSQDQKYAIVRSYCGPIQGGPAQQEHIQVIDLETYAVIHTKQLQTSGDIKVLSRHTGLDISVVSATRSITVKADAVTITSPEVGQTISAGQHTIVGTAPPNVELTVQVDQQTVGTAQSDEFGGWSLQHTFATNKTYIIKALYAKPSQQVRFMPSFFMGFEGFAPLNGVINVFNTQTQKIENKINLPDGYISTNAEVSVDKTKLYVSAHKITTAPNQQPVASNLRLFTIDIASSEIITTTDFSNTVPPLSAIGLFKSSAFSADQQYLYVSTATALQKFTKDGSLIHTIPVTVPAADFQQGEIPRSMIVAEDIKRVYIATTKRAVIINTETDEVQESVLPDSISLQTLEYDPIRKNLISYIAIEQDDITTKSVTALRVPEDENGGQPVWQVDLPQNVGMSSRSVLSADGQKMYLFGTDYINSTAGAYEINLTTGEYTAHVGTLSAQIIELYTDFGEYLGETDQVMSRLTLDGSGTKLYYDLFNPTFTNNTITVQLNIDDPEDQQLIRLPENLSIYESYSIYLNTADHSSAEIPGGVLFAERAVVVKGASQVTPPVTTPATPPSIPVITQPTTEPQPPVQISQARKQSKSELIKKSEKKALSSSAFAKFFGGTKRLFRGLSPSLIKSFPYILYTIILSLAGYYLFQTQKQLRREDRIRSILKKQKVLTEEKRNFLELTSHYLRTPLTYIRSGAEMAARKGGQSEQLAGDMSEAVNHLSLFVESLIEEAGTEKNKLETKPVVIESPLLSRTFLLPALGFTLAIAIYYFISSGIVGIRFESATYFTHLLLSFLILRIFYGMIKNHRLMIAENEQIKEVLAAEKELDHSRSKLLEDAGEQLKTRTDHIAGLSIQLGDDETSKKIIQQGVERLQELARAFSLVCRLEVQTLIPAMKPVSVQTLIQEVIEPFKEQLAQKQLTLNVIGFKESITLTTNKPLAELSLRSLIENAIQASKQGDSVVLKCLSSDGHVAFQVIDHGEGIPKEKIDQLFKPFVRVGPVTTFNREGIGLSLFLDRLIMHSLGGDVEIVSKFEQGTIATLTFNQKSTR